jgi:hypothetical protein
VTCYFKDVVQNGATPIGGRDASREKIDGPCSLILLAIVFPKMALFHILFPEIWAKIHQELVTPLDARDRVSLQRTCKAAHALDPGLLLAPKWHEAWNTVMDVEKGVITRNMKRHRQARSEHKHSILLHFLTQLDRQRVFEWFPPPAGLFFYRYKIGLGDWHDGIALDWNLLPSITGLLRYAPGPDALPPWELQVHVWNDDDGFMSPLYFCNEPRSALSLAGLLEIHPRLFFDTVFDIEPMFESDDDDE